MENHENSEADNGRMVVKVVGLSWLFYVSEDSVLETKTMTT
jgi:hypothetical protein